MKLNVPAVAVPFLISTTFAVALTEVPVLDLHVKATVVEDTVGYVALANEVPLAIKNEVADPPNTNDP